MIAALSDYSREVAFVGQVPNTLGTIPASLGYMGLIVLWDKAGDSWLKRRLLAAGRMALTNYLSQTVLGVLAPHRAAGRRCREPDRDFLPSVWRFGSCSYGGRCTWLDRFRFGPAQWLWRVATYRQGQLLRRG